nr:MAG TPA: hypothetical protein [Bacteriophage sp.]
MAKKRGSRIAFRDPRFLRFYFLCSLAYQKLSENSFDSETLTTFPYFSRALVSKSFGFPTMAITTGFPLMFSL